MATEISGGGIYWKSGIDNSDFKKGEQEIVSGFQRIEKAAQKSGDVLDKSISSKLGANAAQNIAILERELAKYEKTLERVSGSTNLGGKGFDGLKSQIRAIYSEIDRQQAVLSKGGGISSTVIGESEKVVTATKKSASGITNVAGKAFGFLRTLANLIPGLGLAGLIGVIITGLKALWDEFSKGGGALSDFKKNVEITSEALRSTPYIEARKNIAELRNELKLAKEGKIDAKKAIDNYNDSLGKATGGVRSLGEMERKLNELAPAYLEMIQLKTKATIAYNKAAKEGVEADVEAANFGSYKTGMLAFLKNPKQWFNPAASSDPFRSTLGNIAKGRKAEEDLNKLGDRYQARAAEIANKYKLNFFNDTDASIKKAQGNSRKLHEIDEKRLALLNKINQSAEKFQFLDKEENQIAQINSFFDGLRSEVEKFNRDPKNKVKLGFDDIESNRSKALSNADYNQETKALLNELEVRKKEYQDYEEFKKKVGEDVANKQYAELITKHKTYLERLQSEEDVLANKEGGLSKLENARYKQIQEERLKAQAQQKIDEKKAIEERIKSEEDAYRQVLDKANDFYQQKKNLEDKFNLQLKGLENDRNNLTAQEYERRKKIIQDSYNETLKDLEFNNADIFKKLNKDIGRATKQELQSLYNDLDGVIKSGKMRNAAGELVNIPPETLQRLKQARENINQLLKDYTNLQKKVDALASLAPYIQDIADSIGELGDGNTSNILSGVASGIVSLTSAMKNFNVEGGKLKFTGDSLDAYTMAAQFVLQAVSGIINAAAQRKAKLQEFYNDMTAMQNSYNLALLEEIRLRGELRDSVFLKTYSDKVKSGLAAEVETVKQYSKAIKDLQNATVKTGTMKKTDWEKTAKNTVSGVAAGAAIGSVVPVIGTAVGAIVGGVVGFVSGLFSKKRVDVYSGLLQTYPDLLAADGKLNKSRAQALLQGGLLNDQSKQAVQNALNLADAYEKAKEQIEGVISELAGQLGNDIMASLVENYKQGGKDAGEAFLEGFKPTLAKIAQQLLFEALFADSLKGLQDEIKASFLTSGTDDMARIIAEWGQKNKGTAEAYVEGLKTFNDVFSQMGYKDIFGTATSQGSTKSKNSLSGAYAQASQESIDLLSGQTMAFKIAQLETNGHLVQMKDYAFRGLDYAERTANNTANTVARLDTIISKMNNNANNALAAGL
jgi:hypothetical protein